MRFYRLKRFALGIWERKSRPMPLEEVVPLQLFAYYMALEHGVDVDKPRNLSKAVVEAQ